MFEGFLAPSHVLIVAVIALLLFGDRLPEVMRSVGRGVMEFKKGMRGIESAIEAASSSPATANRTGAQNDRDREVISAPRFDPPSVEPRAIDGPIVAEAESHEPAPPV
jgi:sec-independent protein translocase protein TatA